MGDEAGGGVEVCVWGRVGAAEVGGVVGPFGVGGCVGARRPGRRLRTGRGFGWGLRGGAGAGGGHAGREGGDGETEEGAVLAQERMHECGHGIGAER